MDILLSLMGDRLPVAISLATLGVVWVAAWVDFRTFRIPNALAVFGALLGLSIQAWAGGLPGLGQGLLGLGLGLGLLFPVYAIGHMGAGDVKLMAALGALLGPRWLLLVLVLAILAAGIVGLLYALAAWRRRGATGPLARYGRMVRFLLVTGRPSYVPPAPEEALAERLPLAVPIAIGATAALLWPLWP